MYRKLWAIVAFFLIIVVIFLSWAPVYFDVKREIRITAPVEYVGRAFTNLWNWKNWNVDIQQLDSSSIQYFPAGPGGSSSLKSNDHQYTILKSNPEFVQVRVEQGGTVENQAIFALSDTLDKITRVTWIRSLPPWRWLREKLWPEKKMIQSLNNLRNILEDPKVLYGFPITIDPVVDTLVISSAMTSAIKNKIASLGFLYKKIFAYARENHLPVGSNRMANFSLKDRDSIQITAAVSTSKTGPQEKQIVFFEMPNHGRMLVGHYTGPYKDLGKLYVAMEKYYRDRRMKIVASVYEKYLTDPHSPEDSLHMRIEIYYPVY